MDKWGRRRSDNRAYPKGVIPISGNYDTIDPPTRRVPTKYLQTQRRRELIKHFEDTIEGVTDGYDVADVYIAGSFPTNKPEPSDIDVIVVYNSDNIPKDKYLFPGYVFVQTEGVEYHMIPKFERTQEFLDTWRKDAREKYGEDYEFIKYNIG